MEDQYNRTTSTWLTYRSKGYSAEGAKRP